MEQDFVPVGRRRDYGKKPRRSRKEQHEEAPAAAPVKEKPEKPEKPEEDKNGINENTDICAHCFQSLF